ncbi:hypothetical protein RRG08_047032 [Elysia crispata]|uniref:Uncharacterized protein n=1 Tax=Elysia crispata TaxID=231223 RepID=A0AAE1AWX1_9GAST|nr:hypothetical protein RRG08_047032 [Elysia crispata]
MSGNTIHSKLSLCAGPRGAPGRSIRGEYPRLSGLGALGSLGGSLGPAGTMPGPQSWRRRSLGALVTVPAHRRGTASGCHF